MKFLLFAVDYLPRARHSGACLVHRAHPAACRAGYCRALNPCVLLSFVSPASLLAALLAQIKSVRVYDAPHAVRARGMQQQPRDTISIAAGHSRRCSLGSSSLCRCRPRGCRVRPVHGGSVLCTASACVVRPGPRLRPLFVLMRGCGALMPAEYPTPSLAIFLDTVTDTGVGQCDDSRVVQPSSRLLLADLLHPP